MAFVDITSNLLLVSLRYWESSSKFTEAEARSTRGRWLWQIVRGKVNTVTRKVTAQAECIKRTQPNERTSKTNDLPFIQVQHLSCLPVGRTIYAFSECKMCSLVYNLSVSGNCKLAYTVDGMINSFNTVFIFGERSVAEYIEYTLKWHLSALAKCLIK